MKKWRSYFITLFFIFVSFLSLCMASLRSPKYYLNLSASEPVGLYRLMPNDGHLKVGDLVIFKVPVQASPYIYGRSWLPEGWSLIKNVGALPGDIVHISDNALYINDIYRGPVFDKDREGKSLPQIRGDLEIPKGYFFPLATDIPNSFDGRYFGVVPVSEIFGKARLVYNF